MKIIEAASILTIALFCFSCKGQSQQQSAISQENQEPSEEKTSLHSYGAGDVVKSCYLDRVGNMWFGTMKEGVFIYNGETFTNISIKDGLCSNEVNAILEDQDGVMWFGTDKGLCSFDGKEFTQIALPTNETPKFSPKTGRASRETQTILSLIQSKDGDYWIGTDAMGAYRYDGKEFSSYLKFEGRIQPVDSVYNNCITNIIEDKNGHIWIGSFTHGGLNEIDGESITHHSLKDGYGDGMISTSYKDRHGNLWFGSRNGGLYKYNYSKFENVFDKNTGEQIPMASIVLDKDDRIWIGSFARKGAYNFKDEAFVPLNVEGAEKLFDIKCMAEDKDGNIWFGGRYGLLWRFDGNELKDFTQLKRTALKQ